MSLIWEAFWIFCALVTVAGFLALIGHALWLGFASLIRVVTGHSAEPVRAGTTCFICFRPQSVVNGRCRACGADAESEVARQRADLFALRRQFDRWLQAGKLTPESFKTLQALLDEESGSAGPATAASPIETSPAASEPIQVPPAHAEPPLAPPPAPISPAALDSAEPIYTAEVIDVHPLDRPSSPVAAPSPPSAPRRAFADMLQAFMEQKNIRWIELLSGLLIVGCAIGLVISLRAALQDRIPYFPALSFLLITGAFHAAGLYSLRRWNLQSTSRGVLIIATLLVPLSIVAGIVLGGEGEQRRSIADPIFWLAVGIGLTSFGTMNYFASRALVRHGWWRMVVAVMGSAIGQLVISRSPVSSLTPIGAAVVIAPAIAAYLIANLAQLLPLNRRRRWQPRHVYQFYLELAISTFSVLVAIGLFFSQSDSLTRSLQILSPELSLVAAVLLAAGWFAHRRIEDPQLIAYKLAGTALAICAAGIMVRLVADAWPNLPLVIAVGLLNFATLTALAMIADLAILHLLAAACLALAYLGAFHLWRGSLPAGTGPSDGLRLAQAVLTGSSGVALACFATVIAVGGGWLRSIGRRHVGWAYVMAGRALGIGSAAIALYAGFWGGTATDQVWVTPLLAYLAVAAAWTGWQTRRAAASGFASGLLLAACIHALCQNAWLHGHLAAWGIQLERPILTGTLVHTLLAAITAAGVAIFLRRGGDSDAERTRESVVQPWTWTAIFTSLAAVPFALLVRDRQFGLHAGYLLLAAPAWVMGSIALRSPAAWRMFQGILTFEIGFATTAWSMRQPWWTGELGSAVHLYWQFVALALSCWLWLGARQLFRRHGDRPAWLPGAESSLDSLLLALMTVALPVAALVGCLPGIADELGITATVLTENTLERWSTDSAWLAVAAVLAALGGAIWERRALSGWLAMVLVSATIPFLIAGLVWEAGATASSLRWLFALFAAAWYIPACLGGGRAARDAAAVSPRWVQDVPPLRTPADVQRTVSLVTAMVVVVGLTTVTLVRVASGLPVAGPDPGTFFARAGSATSYAAPLGLLVLVLLAYAVREGRAGFACAASLMFQYFVSLACLLPELSAGADLTAASWAQLLQWNAAGGSVFTAVWLAARRWIDRDETTATEISRRPISANDRYLTGQFLLIAVLLGAMATWVTLAVWSDPLTVMDPVLVLGRWPSYLGLAVMGVCLGWATRSARRPGDSLQVRLHAVHLWLLVLIPLVAASIHHRDASSLGWALHTLGVGWCVVAAGMVGWMYWMSRHLSLTASRPFEALWLAEVGWGTAAIILSSVSIGLHFDDLSQQGWGLAAIWCNVLLLGAIAVRHRSQSFVFGSVTLGAIAATLLHASLPAGSPWKTPFGGSCQFVAAVLALAAAWLGAEIWFQRRGEPGLSTTARGATHRVIAKGSLLLVELLIVAVSFRLLVSDRPLPMKPAETAALVAAFLSYLLLHAGSLWDRHGRIAVLALYSGTLLAALTAVDCMAWTDSARRVAFITVLAAQVTLSGWIWNWGGKLAVLGSRLGMTDPIGLLRGSVAWLVRSNQLLAATVLIIATAEVLFESTRALRVTSACLPLLLAAGLAGMAQQHRRDAMQLAAWLTAGWGVVLLGWSDLEPDHTLVTSLARAIRLLMAAVTVSFVAGVLAVRVLKRESSWRASAQRAAVILVAVSLFALSLVLGLEVASFRPGLGAPVDGPQIAAVAVVLVGLIVTLISLAVLPGRDPWALTERGRMGYVYGAQIVAALLFAHLYMTLPELFSGRLRAYWPYIVLAIAFAGVGVGTLMERLQWRVLSEPFQRSGAFLPILPALGIWFFGSQTHHAAVLFVIGLLYMLITFTQHSTWAGIAAALACNAALWALFDDYEHLAFEAHPQFWLIPPALSAMVAAHYHRHRLNNVQQTAVRYCGMAVIYLSSSFEMLQIGIGESLWPPVILISLSMAGVLFGIALRIRAYLYLGSAFVVVSLMSIVAHASRAIDHVWPWYAFGIGLGVLLLIVFGYFEGRRAQMLAWIDHLRQWDR